MVLPMPANRRQSERYPLERLAKFEPVGGGPSDYCLVTDISDGGVRITTYGAKIPDEFVLSLAGDGPAMNGTYRVAWRIGSDAGARRVQD
jgi:hypothetical protein